MQVIISQRGVPFKELTEGSHWFECSLYLVLLVLIFKTRMNRHAYCVDDDEDEDEAFS